MSEPSDPVRFDDVKPRALQVARQVTATTTDVLAVRDLLGRVALILDDRQTPPQDEQVEGWRRQLADGLGGYVSARPLLLASTLFEADRLFDSPRAVEIDRPGNGGGSLRWLETGVVGEDWSPVRPARSVGENIAPRVALYGFKGGVGRSTAIAMLAKHLANAGDRVLVIDLDLESPGSGPLLLSAETTPQFGLVDQLVESAVDNAAGLDLVGRASNYEARAGEIWVAPARGRGSDKAEYSYVEKLNRIYADVSPGAGLGTSFADRLEAAVGACEAAVADQSGRPDVVLLDSRAGIHDVAAVTISHLADLTLLFGADNRHTWMGYQDLFTAWRDAGQARTVRERLRMIASMVPDSTERPKEGYLDSFRERAWSCFSILYDDLPAGVTADGLGEAYNPSPEDDSAPHSPVPILFTTDLVGMDAVVSPDWWDRSFVRTAYGDFLDTVALLVASVGRQ